jgi:hypothetical protein
MQKTDAIRGTKDVVAVGLHDKQRAHSPGVSLFTLTDSVQELDRDAVVKDLISDPQMRHCLALPARYAP